MIPAIVKGAVEFAVAVSAYVLCWVEECRSNETGAKRVAGVRCQGHRSGK